MKMMHLLPGLLPEAGGPSRSVPRLCEELGRQGHEVELWTFSEGEPNKQWTAFELVRFRGFMGRPELPGTAFLKATGRELGRFDVVILHGLWNVPATWVARRCREIGIPYVVSPMGMLRRAAMKKSASKKKAYYAALERATMDGAAFVRYFNETDAHESMAVTGPAMAVELIANGIDHSIAHSQRTSFKAEYSQLTNKRIVVFVGRLHWSKNLRLQCDAFRLLAQGQPEVAWLLIGPDGGEREWLEAEVARLGLTDRVVFAGLQTEDRCLDALAEAEVFAMTSLHEGHSMAMNEALAMGVPVVMTRSVGFERAAVAGAAILVDSEASAVAAAVQKVLENGQLADEMRSRAKRLVKEELGWERIAERFVEAIERHAKIRAAGEHRGTEPSRCQHKDSA